MQLTCIQIYRNKLKCIGALYVLVMLKHVKFANHMNAFYKIQKNFSRKLQFNCV